MEMVDNLINSQEIKEKDEVLSIKNDKNLKNRNNNNENNCI